jgi:hypothetical protein
VVQDRAGVERAVNAAEDGEPLIFHNPPLALLKKTHSPDVIFSFDHLPDSAAYARLAGRRVWVPSLTFRAHFRARGVQAETVRPRLADGEEAEGKQTVLSAVSQKKIRLWIDDRLVDSSIRPSLFQAVRGVMRQTSAFQPVWVTSRPFSALPDMTVLRPEEAEREKAWRTADLVITCGHFRRSFVPHQLAWMAQGTAVITDDGGDHAEWVPHLHAGLVVDRKHVASELSSYLARLAKHPFLVSHFKGNALRLARTKGERTGGKS